MHLFHPKLPISSLHLSNSFKTIALTTSSTPTCFHHVYNLNLCNQSFHLHKTKKNPLLVFEAIWNVGWKHIKVEQKQHSCKVFHCECSNMSKTSQKFFVVLDMSREMDIKEKSMDIHNKFIWAILVYFVFYWSIKKISKCYDHKK
jgi:hypothetical protein